MSGFGGPFSGGGIGSGQKISTTQTSTTTTASTGYGRDIGGSNYAGLTAASGGSITLTDQGALQAAFALADRAFQSVERAGQGVQSAYQVAAGEVSSAYSAGAQAGGALGTQELTKYGIVAIALVAAVWALTRTAK